MNNIITSSRKIVLLLPLLFCCTLSFGQEKKLPQQTIQNHTNIPFKKEIVKNTKSSVEKNSNADSKILNVSADKKNKVTPKMRLRNLKRPTDDTLVNTDFSEVNAIKARKDAEVNSQSVK